MNENLKPLRRNKRGNPHGPTKPAKPNPPPSSTPSGPDQVRNPAISQGARQLASIIRAYYLALLAQGFEHEDALQLTIAYQASALAATQQE